MSLLLKKLAILQQASAGGGTPTVTLKQYWLKPWLTQVQAPPPTGANPMTVTAGSTLIAVTVGWDGTRQIPLPTDSAGTFVTPVDAGSTSALLHPDKITVGISTQVNATGGSHTIAVPAINDGTVNGDQGELGVWIFEVTNMRSTLLVRDVAVGYHLNTTKPWSLSTDSTPQVNDIIIGVGVEENTAATNTVTMSNPPTGYTALAVNTDGATFLPTTIFYNIVTSAGVQSVSVTTNDANKSEDFLILLTLSPT